MIKNVKKYYNKNIKKNKLINKNFKNKIAQKNIKN